MQHEMVMNVLTDPLAQQLLQSPLVTRLGYSGLDGSPRVVPIGYLWNGTSFIMCTAVKAPKVRALTANPKVAMTIDTDTQPPHILLVRGTASVEIVDGVPDEFLEASRKDCLRSTGPRSKIRSVPRTRRWHASRSNRNGPSSSTSKRGYRARSKSSSATDPDRVSARRSGLGLARHICRATRSLICALGDRCAASGERAIGRVCGREHRRAGVDSPQDGSEAVARAVALDGFSCDAELGYGSRLMTVARTGAASSSRSGAYAPVAAACRMCTSRASADSQSAISTRTSGFSSTS
jgi:hypothetical protein